MTSQTQLPTAIAAAVSSTLPEAPPQQTLYTVEQFAQVEPSFTTPALRNLIFKSQARHSSEGVIPGNGLVQSGAVVRLGRKILIHRAKFLAWVQQ